MPIPDGPYVFVSYSNKDASFVRKECHRIEREGYRVWYDHAAIEPSEFWDDAIIKALRACTCFLVFITEDSIRSRHVLEEIHEVLTADKPFIAVYWDNVALPGELQERVRLRQTLDRYALHQSSYEEPLSNTLSKYIPGAMPIVPRFAPPPPPPPKPELLPRILFFALLLAAVSLLFFGVVFAIAPNIMSAKSPDDLRNNRLIGIFGLVILAGIASGLSLAAFAVYRLYLRRKDD